MNSTATQMMEKEHRLRAKATAAAARAMEAVKGVDGVDTRAVYDVAINAAMLAIQLIIENDAELVATRIERDHYKSVALHRLETMPPAIMIVTPD